MINTLINQRKSATCVTLRSFAFQVIGGWLTQVTRHSPTTGAQPSGPPGYKSWPRNGWDLLPPSRSSLATNQSAREEPLGRLLRTPACWERKGRPGQTPARWLTAPIQLSRGPQPSGPPGYKSWPRNGWDLLPPSRSSLATNQSAREEPLGRLLRTPACWERKGHPRWLTAPIQLSRGPTKWYFSPMQYYLQT